MANKLFVVKFSEEADFIVNAIEDFIASNVSGMNTEVIDYELLYDYVEIEKVFDNEAEARKYFNAIRNILINMEYSLCESNRDVIFISEPVKKECIIFELMEIF